MPTSGSPKFFAHVGIPNIQLRSQVIQWYRSTLTEEQLGETPAGMHHGMPASRRGPQEAFIRVGQQPLAKR